MPTNGAIRSSSSVRGDSPEVQFPHFAESDSCTWVQTPEGYAHISYYHNGPSADLRQVHKKVLAYTTRRAGRRNRL
jgi:hypothetical protein